MVHEKVLSTPQQGLSDEDVHKTRNEANEAALKIALYVLRTMNEEERARTLEQSKTVFCLTSLYLSEEFAVATH